MRGLLPALAAALLLVGAGPASAERLVLSISQPQVRISSSFTGAELVVFGVAVTDAEEPPPDVVVSVRGPPAEFTTWRKTRLLGLWVNSDSRTFLEVPSFLAVLSSRETDAMAAPQTLRVEQIGLARNIFLQRVGTDYADVVPTDPFRAAFLRIQKAQGLYAEDPKGVTFIAPNVFRAEVAIPGTAAIGAYRVDVKLLRNGELAAAETATFEVQKIGFEQRTALLAQHHGLLYGLAVAMGSLAVGFIANLLFRKD